MGEIDGAGGVDRPQDLSGGVSLGLEVELHAVTLTEQSVVAAGQADAVDLEAMAQPRLGDTPAGGQVVDQAADLGGELGLQIRQMGGDDAAQQEATEARRRIGG
jgi:hypothetical protein